MFIYYVYDVMFMILIYYVYENITATNFETFFFSRIEIAIKDRKKKDSTRTEEQQKNSDRVSRT